MCATGIPENAFITCSLKHPWIIAAMLCVYLLGPSASLIRQACVVQVQQQVVQVMHQMRIQSSQGLLWRQSLTSWHTG